MTNVCVRLAWTEATKMFCLFLECASLQFFIFFKIHFILLVLFGTSEDTVAAGQRSLNLFWSWAAVEVCCDVIWRVCESQGSRANWPHLSQVFCRIMKARTKAKRRQNVFFDGISSLLKTFQRLCSPIKLFCVVVVSGSKYVPAVDWRLNEQAVLTSSCCCSEAPCEKEERK